MTAPGSADAGAGVWAVVVTYRRPAVARRCLEALTGQSCPPEAVLMVVNGSRDDPTGTLAALREASLPSLETLPLPDNQGPAGGFAAGMEAAMARGASRLWVMDDDALPAADCLERLLACGERSGGTSLLFPTVTQTDGRVHNYPGWSGVLIPAAAVTRAGVPRRELFWWVEDTEYLQWRLPRAGFPAKRCPEARVEHAADAPRRRPPWRLYYEVRNTLVYRLRIQSGRPVRRLWRSTVVLLSALAAALRQPPRGRALGAVAKGLGDGLRGRLGKRWEPTTDRRYTGEER